VNDPPPAGAKPPPAPPSLRRTRHTPWKKRWPGQYAMKASFVTPRGSLLEFETDVPTELIEPFLTAVAEYMGKSDHQQP
jgi:hypothetical protein